MPHYASIAVSNVLQEANEQVNIYDSGRSLAEYYGLPVALETPDDWLA